MKSHRPERVASVIRIVVSDAIANRLSDPRIAPMTSVTRVEVSGDLEHAKVYVSVPGNSAAERRTAAGLASAVGHVRSMVGRQLRLRRCPHLSFHLDESAKKAAQIIQIIDESMAQIDPAAPASPSPPATPPVNSPSGDDT